MSVSPITSASPAAEAAWARSLNAPLGMPSVRGTPEQPGPEDIKKAAGQFEAIILRQLLSPTIEPMMSGGLGDSGAAGSGGGAGVYSYLLTDVLSSSLGASGGLGLARMLEKQLSPPAKHTDQPSSTPSSITPDQS